MPVERRAAAGRIVKLPWTVAAGECCRSGPLGMPCRPVEHAHHDVQGMIVMLVMVFAAGLAAGLARTMVMHGLGIHCSERLLSSAVIELLERQASKDQGCCHSR